MDNNNATEKCNTNLESWEPGLQDRLYLKLLRTFLESKKRLRKCYYVFYPPILYILFHVTWHLLIYWLKYFVIWKQTNRMLLGFNRLWQGYHFCQEMGRHLPGKKVPSLERKVRKSASRAFLQLDGKNPIKMALKKSKNENKQKKNLL